MTSRIRPARSKSASRRMLGVLAIFLLNLVMVPCTMATEVDAEIEPCPMMSEQAMGQEGQHDSKASVDCLSMQLDCCSLISATANGRSSAEKLQHDVFVAISAPATWPALQTRIIRDHDVEPPDPELCFPPLHVLNCVYLD